jgi:hypothetical protein
MKTSELTGIALDWAVAKCVGVEIIVRQENWDWYSSSWGDSGMIIEREKISIEWTGEDWMAYIEHDEEFFGQTPLIAAMRCYVASKLGDDIEIPEELNQGEGK